MSSSSRLDRLWAARAEQSRTDSSWWQPAASEEGEGEMSRRLPRSDCGWAGERVRMRVTDCRGERSTRVVQRSGDPFEIVRRHPSCFTLRPPLPPPSTEYVSFAQHLDRISTRTTNARTRHRTRIAVVRHHLERPPANQTNKPPASSTIHYRTSTHQHQHQLDRIFPRLESCDLPITSPDR